MDAVEFGTKSHKTFMPYLVMKTGITHSHLRKEAWIDIMSLYTYLKAQELKEVGTQTTPVGGRILVSDNQ